MTWKGEERRKNTVDVEALAGEIMKQVIEVLKPIRQDLSDLKDDVKEINLSLHNKDNTGISQRLGMLWGTVYGNGKPGLCEKHRFLNWKVTFFASLGTSAVFFVRWLVEVLRG